MQGDTVGKKFLKRCIFPNHSGRQQLYIQKTPTDLLTV